MQAVSRSHVRRAQAAVLRTRPYAQKAWQVLIHIAGQPGRETLHPLLSTRSKINNVLVVMISGDRGLAGAYNTNILRFTLQRFNKSKAQVKYVAVGRKGRDLLFRRHKHILAEFSGLPAAPSFADVSAIGHLAVDEFLVGNADEVYLAYTDYLTLTSQAPDIKKLLPLEIAQGEGRVVTYEPSERSLPATYIYEPGEAEILDQIIPRFTALQIYQAILESLASEHAARMIAMKNATDNATDLAAGLTLEYNKARQQSITNEMLDIAGGAEASAQALKK